MALTIWLNSNKDGIRSAAIHGNKSQGARTRALADFKSGDIRVLVATDIAARGLDIEELPHVVNYELPNVPEDYVHRIGRTVRRQLAKHCRWCVLMSTNCCVISKTAEKEIPRIAIPGMSRTRQSKPNRSRTVASNVAAVVDRAVVAVNSNHAVRKVVRSLVTRSPQKTVSSSRRCQTGRRTTTSPPSA